MTNKKIISLFLFGFLLLSACDGSPTAGDKAEDITQDVPDVPAVPKLRISISRLKIATGDTARITATVLKGDSTIAEGEKIEWSVVDTTILTRADDGIIYTKKEGNTVIRASFEEVSEEVVVEVFNFLGRVVLENQDDHAAVMISWFRNDDKEDYLPTDKLGYYVIPQLADGEWVVKAEYPYYAWQSDTIVVTNGKPQRMLKTLFLTQQLAFEVILDRIKYSVNDTLWIQFKATNLTDETLFIGSLNYPIHSIGYAITKNGKPLIIDSGTFANPQGFVWGYTFYSAGIPVLDHRILQPGETILEPYRRALSIDEMYIDLKALYDFGGMQKGKTYQIYAGYIGDRSYPWQYFTSLYAHINPSIYGSEPKHLKLFNYSLYKKLTPVSIIITHQ